MNDITNEESIDDQKTWLNMPLAIGSSFKGKETFIGGCSGLNGVDIGVALQIIGSGDSETRRSMFWVKRE